MHRYNFRKDKLVKMGFDPNKTENQIMFEEAQTKCPLMYANRKKYLIRNKNKHKKTLILSEHYSCGYQNIARAGHSRQ